MEKLGVVTEEKELTKTGSSVKACPKCASVVTTTYCPNCGTEPWEPKKEESPKAGK